MSNFDYSVRTKWLLIGLAVPFFFHGVQSPAQDPEEHANVSSSAPLDPLSVDERAAAERLARSDGKVKEIVGESGVRLVSAEPILAKKIPPRESDLTVREVEVVLFRPDNEAGARVLVDLRRGSVLEVLRLRTGQVPMTFDDLADAFQLAARDAEVQRLLGPSIQDFKVQAASSQPGIEVPENIVTGLPLRSTDPKDPCATHRCMELFFRRGNDYLSEPVVLVDLTRKKVIVERRKLK